MYKWKSKIVCFIIGFFVLTNCSDSTSKSYFDAVSIKDSEGNYACADKNGEYLMYSNRKKVDAWETFRILFNEDSTVVIETSEFAKIRLNDNGNLVFGSSEDKKFEPFVLTQIDSLHFTFRTVSGKPVFKDSLEQLSAGTATSEPEIFQIVPVSKTQEFFSVTEYLVLILSFVFILFSLVFFIFYRKYKWSIVLLVIGGLVLRIFIAMLDPFLHVWDEQFHALVAKNMMEHPFSPMLYQNQDLAGGGFSWISSHIWLHKQPLFLWQMALSMKVFGVSAFAARIPSILLSTLVIGFIYRVGSLIANKNVGYYGAVLFAVSNFCLTLVAGGYATEHNDIAFMFYISASIWAWVEYKNTDSIKRKYVYLILIGLFSGAAVLTKWLVGLLVYSGWGVSILVNRKERIKIKN